MYYRGLQKEYNSCEHFLFLKLSLRSNKSIVRREMLPREQENGVHDTIQWYGSKIIHHS
jgi:hypothetical protein